MKGGYTMKKILYIGALSALLLAACGEEKAAPKEETPASEEKNTKDEVAETKGPTQEELDAKLKEEAIKLDFVKANGGEVAKDTKVTIKGKITNITDDGMKFTLTTTEGDGYGMFNIINVVLKDIKLDDEVTIYGRFNGKDDLGAPSIAATIIE